MNPWQKAAGHPMVTPAPSVGSPSESSSARSSVAMDSRNSPMQNRAYAFMPAMTMNSAGSPDSSASAVAWRVRSAAALRSPSLMPLIWP